MSFTKQLTVWCDNDECFEWEQLSYCTQSSAVTEFKQLNWVFKKEKSYCPKCAKRLGLKGQKKITEDRGKVINVFDLLKNK